MYYTHQSTDLGAGKNRESNSKEARKIGKLQLNKKLANCVNFFPITCIYSNKLGYDNFIGQDR